MCVCVQRATYCPYAAACAGEERDVSQSGECASAWKKSCSNSIAVPACCILFRKG